MNRRWNGKCLRRIFGWGLALAASWTVSAGAQPPDLSKMDIVERSLPDGPVALVDGKGVSRGDFLFLYRTELLAMAEHGHVEKLPDKARVMAGLVSLRKLLEREILYQEALNRKISITDKEVDAAYQARLDSLKKELTGADGAAPDETHVLEKARQTREEALASVRKTLLVDKISESIAGEKKSPVKEDEIRKFYDNRADLFRRPGTVHLLQIFVKPGPSPKEATEAGWEKARKTMDKALARIRAGESFETVAKEVSEAPDRERGGDMGPMAEASLPPFFVDAVRSMQPGAMSDIIRSDLGLHLIKLTGRDAGGEIAFDQAKDRIAALLNNVKNEELVSNFCQGVLDQGRVQIFLQLERHLATLPGNDGDEGSGSKKEAAPKKDAPDAKQAAKTPAAKEVPKASAAKETKAAPPQSKPAAKKKK